MLSHKEKCKLWSQNNKEKHKASKQLWYIKNKEKALKYQQQYNNEHKEELQQYRKNRYLKNRETLIKQAAISTQQRREKHKKILVDYKGSKCIYCGYAKYMGALEFHHTLGKKDFTISSKMSWNIGALKKEVDKCILVCSNCHREIHGGVLK